jgi:hypothetical protein
MGATCGGATLFTLGRGTASTSSSAAVTTSCWSARGFKVPASILGVILFRVVRYQMLPLGMYRMVYRRNDID